MEENNNNLDSCPNNELFDPYEVFAALSPEEKKVFLDKMVDFIVENSEFKRKTMEVLYKETDGKTEIVGIIDK